MEKWYSVKSLMRMGVFAVSIMIMLIVMPRTDQKSYSYELNEPWKYPLLTAEFDIPVVPDSLTIVAMKDTINVTYPPYVTELDITKVKKEELRTQLAGTSLRSNDREKLIMILDDIYSRKVMDAGLYSTIVKLKKPQVVKVNVDNPSTHTIADASSYFKSSADALDYLDSAYNAYLAKYSMPRNDSIDDRSDMLTEELKSSIYTIIVPNVILDSETDSEYRKGILEEMISRYGEIKAGQKIVDRGEIITPQIYNNINTYLKQVNEKDSQTASQIYYLFGRVIIITLIMGLFYLFLWHYRREYFESWQRLSLLVAYITLFVIFAVVMFEYVPNGLMMVPFAAIPVILLVFFDSRTAIFTLMVTVLISSLVATFPYQFIILEMLAGIVATVSMAQLTRRSQLLQTAILTFLMYCVTYVGMSLVTDGASVNIEYRYFGYFAINAVILSFAYILILVIEKIFGLTSNVTLVELSDINNPLLRRLAREAPGTFQHSVQVSTLAAEAAAAIGADTLLVRTGAMYHDIGKLDNPIYFTENQHGVNPHNGLDPQTSAQRIISHIVCGVKLARHHKLPKAIKDFIRQHHGKGVAKYFYTTACNENGIENVDKSLFQYPGPDPQSKETAILMMADAVEAASRSLKEYTVESITGLVNKIIDGQLADGMFKEAPISFRDIDLIKKTFINRLGTIYHTRVAYPELNKNKK